MELLECTLKSTEIVNDSVYLKNDTTNYEKCDLMASLNLVSNSQESPPNKKPSYNFRHITKELLTISNFESATRSADKLKLKCCKITGLSARSKNTGNGEESTRRKNKRHGLSGTALLEWRLKEAQRVRNRRARYTPEQRAAWRKKSAERARERRKRFTEEQLQLWRSRNAAYSRTRRAKMSEEQLQERRKRSRERAQERRANLTQEQKDRERVKHLERKIKRKLQMSPREYAQYLEQETKKRKERRHRETTAAKKSKPTKTAQMVYKKKKVNLTRVLGENGNSSPSSRIPGRKSCICLLCYEQVPCRKILRRHMLEQHKLQIPFPCGLCWRSFPRRNDLARHRTLIHQQQETCSCSICGKQSADFSLILNHGRTHLNQRSIFQVVPQDGQEIFICKLCQIIFVKKEMYIAHNEWNHMGEVISDLGHHCNGEKGATKGKTHMCEHCGKLFGIKHKLNIHFIMDHPEILHDIKESKHHSKTILKPSVDLETILNDDKRKQNYTNHTCMLSGEIFMKESILDNHLKTVHHKLMTNTNVKDWNKNDWNPSVEIVNDSEKHLNDESDARKIESNSCIFCGLTIGGKVK